VKPAPTLDEIRRHAKRELATLPDALRQLTPGATVTVEIADDLVKLAADVDRRLHGQAAAAARTKP
jgi:hypothetical protein